MKKIFKFLTIVVASLCATMSLSACGSPDNSDPTPESVAFNSETITIESKGTKQIEYTVMPEGASAEGFSVSVSDEKIVKYENGTLTAISSGTATITVANQDNTITDSCTITVNAPTGYTLNATEEYKFVYPSSWTKSISSGIETWSALDDSANVNIVESNDSLNNYNFTIEFYLDMLEETYSMMGFDAELDNGSLTRDTYFGCSRVHISFDSHLTISGISTFIHQEQVVMFKNNQSYALTITFSTEDYDDTIASTIISEYIIL